MRSFTRFFSKEAIGLVLGLSLLLAMIWGPAAIGQMTASQRIASQQTHATYPVDVVVHLSFEPSRFHRDIIREFGTYDGARSSATELFLRRVDYDAVRALGRLYWIDVVEVLSG